MTRRRLGWLGLWLVALSSAGCFDVQKIDTTCDRLVVDDFEDDDLAPSLTDWTPWTCDGASCGIEQPGYHSGRNLFVEFEIQMPTTVLSTSSRAGPIDLRPYKFVDFAVWLESGVPVLPLGTAVTLEINCPSVPLIDSASGGDHGVSITLHPIAEWMPVSYSTMNISPNDIKNGVPACMKAVESITVSVVPPLVGSPLGHGKLRIDNIVFDPRCGP